MRYLQQKQNDPSFALHSSETTLGTSFSVKWKLLFISKMQTLAAADTTEQDAFTCGQKAEFSECTCNSLLVETIDKFSNSSNNQY